MKQPVFDPRHVSPLVAYLASTDWTVDVVAEKLGGALADPV